MDAPASGLLINMDDGGTLTNICVIDSARVHHTKALTPTEVFQISSASAPTRPPWTSTSTNGALYELTEHSMKRVLKENN